MAGSLSSSITAIFGQEDGKVAGEKRLAALGIGAALAVSLLLVRLASNDWQVVGIAAATFTLLGAILFLTRTRGEGTPIAGDRLPPDWS
ncbi:MAG: hypothetical protein ACK44T_00270, partial [Sphingomonadales bacterium]